MFTPFIIACIAIAVLSFVIPLIAIGVKERNGTPKHIPENEEGNEKPDWEYAKSVYRCRYILWRGPRWRSRKTIRIRPEHYETLKKITHIIGRDRITLIRYLDNVIEAHFVENSHVINELYREMNDDLIKTDLINTDGSCNQ